MSESTQASPPVVRDPAVLRLDDPVVDLTLDDDDDELQVIYVSKGKRAKGPTPVGELELVSHHRHDALCNANSNSDSRPTSTSQTSLADGNNNDSEVTVLHSYVACDPLSNYAHPRHLCQAAVKPSDFCSKCFCFACDIPAADCKKWEKHHLATNSPEWQEYRRKSKIFIQAVRARNLTSGC